MLITYLGHAGFYVETPESIIIMDPWLSKHGAFDAAWFQYPKNHHLAEDVQKILSNSQKQKYIYISHEHRDHFDIEFLQTLQNRDFILLIANFSCPTIKLELDKINYQCKKIILLNDNECFQLADGELRLFIVDFELNCDSAILIKTSNHSFLNLNDCKIYDRLNNIITEHGAIDVLTAQFSGASWHPTCYKMSKVQYNKICKQKINSKFATIATMLALVKPKIYLPSAGPPCFLDPTLLSINFQTINTYPRAPKLISYLNKYHKSLQKHTKWTEIFPGDKLDPTTLTFNRTNIEYADFPTYITNYAAEYRAFFQQRADEDQRVNPQQVLSQLIQILNDKLQIYAKNNIQLNTLLYWRLKELPNSFLCVDFIKNQISSTILLDKRHPYVCLTTTASQINKVINGIITWPDFALTLRVQIERSPDTYNTLLHGFIILDLNKMTSFCYKMSALSRQKDKITVNCQGKQYIIDRYCPHQGGDLLQGHAEGDYWICPIHKWRFDLKNQGRCLHNDSTINSISLIDDSRHE